MLAIDRLLSADTIDRSKIDAFLRDREIPIVEGPQVTFVFHGRADEVNLRHFIFGLPSSQPFHRIESTDLWYLVLELPERSRIEYKIERVIDEAREWLMDPLNPRTVRDPYGANSVCATLGYEEPSWVVPDDEARPGTLEQLDLHSSSLASDVSVGIYLPARFRRTRRYPLLVVHDGRDYLRFAALKTTLDNLIHRLEIPSMIVALTASTDRLREYAADPRHAGFLTNELLPALETRYHLLPDAGSRGLMGASFGAVAALHTAWAHPGVWGRLLLQSGSFAFSDIGHHGRSEAFDPVARFVNAFRADPGRPAEKLFVSCGTYESLIYENRSLIPLLQPTGMELRYVESRDGHNWENWRDRLREGLSWLYPGPLWMVYE